MKQDKSAEQRHAVTAVIVPYILCNVILFYLSLIYLLFSISLPLDSNITSGCFYVFLCIYFYNKQIQCDGEMKMINKKHNSNTMWTKRS